MTEYAKGGIVRPHNGGTLLQLGARECVLYPSKDGRHRFECVRTHRDHEVPGGRL